VNRLNSWTKIMTITIRSSANYTAHSEHGATFVVRTRKDLYIERIHYDEQWWRTQLSKLETFYFKALLPELACPLYHTGGIRETQEP